MSSDLEHVIRNGWQSVLGSVLANGINIGIIHGANVVHETGLIAVGQSVASRTEESGMVGVTSKA